MGTITYGMIYGRSMPGRDTPAAGPAPSEAASGPDALDDVGKPDYAPAIVILAILGALTALRVVWEFAERITE